MLRLLVVLFRGLRSAVRSHTELVLENLALRQQLAAFAHDRRRPRLTPADRWFWIALRRLWSRWVDVVVFVKPETVIRWHRAGFRHYWTWLSHRRAVGRPSPTLVARYRRSLEHFASFLKECGDLPKDDE